MRESKDGFCACSRTTLRLFTVRKKRISRLNSDKRLVAGEEFDYVKVIVENCVPVALSAKEIEQASFDDEDLSMVKNCVKSGKWSQCKAAVSYLHVKDELYIYGELLLCGTRIVIRNILRDQVLKITYEDHQGRVKTKTRLRSKVGRPKMDSDMEKLCKTCRDCQVVGEFGAPELMSRVVPPTAPCPDVSADVIRPLPTGESILVLMDYFSRFLEVAVLKSTTTAKIIEAIHPIFARLRVPNSLRTDNGSQSLKRFSKRS